MSVKGDASQLGKLVTVLLDNAVKYASGTADEAGEAGEDRAGSAGRVAVRLEPAGRGRARLWVNSEGRADPEGEADADFPALLPG